MNQPVSPLFLLAESYITEACPKIRPELFAEMLQIISHFLRGVITCQRASEIFTEKIGTSTPVGRIDAIMRVADHPIVVLGDRESFLPMRRRSHPWSEYEDRRLICGITKFGFESWAAIAQFVGNGRTRAQCAQRWYRGLDPRISRFMWTHEEEKRLLELVSIHGPHSWTRISADLGSRSDAQCRYHYMQMMKENPSQRTSSETAACLPVPDLRPRKPPLPPIGSLIELGGLPTPLMT
jgi:hypothetical protein